MAIPKRFRYDAKFYPDKNQILVMFSGTQNYYKVLRSALPNYFSKLFDEQFYSFDHATYIRDVNSQAEHEHILGFLNFLQQHVFIDDNLEQTFALDYHHIPYFEDSRGGKSKIGELIYQSKPYNREVTESHRQNAQALASYMIDFIKAHPAYMACDFVASVPYYEQKSFDLPEYLVKCICKAINIKDGSQYLKKVRSTKGMKDKNLTWYEKQENIKEAFGVDPKHPFNGKTVLIIDDVYETGLTIHELSMVLQKAGATVRGLVGTKTISGPN